MHAYGKKKLVFFHNFRLREGGRTRLVTKIWLYDIASREFTGGPNLSEQRNDFDGCSLGARFFVFCGENKFGMLLKSVEYLELEDQGAQW